MSTALQHATVSLPAEQWMTLVPVEGERATGPWQPTPPASWANKPPTVSPSTVSAGQVSAPSPPARPSRRGAWLALAGLALAAGGVTVGVMLARDHGDRAQAGSAEPPHAQAATTPPAPTPTPLPAQIPTTVAPLSEGSLDGDLGDQVDAAFSELPPEVRKQLPPKLSALLTKYGSFSKIPAGELAAMSADVAQLGNTAGRQVNQALVSDTANLPTHPAGLIALHDVTIPSFDANRVDTEALVQLAQAEAKRDAPDALLIRFDLENVRPDGTADLTLPVGIRSATLMIRFQSPSHARVDSNKPRGSTPAACELQLRVDVRSAQMLPSPSCDEKPAGPAHCTVKAIWKRALAKHPELGDAVAEIHYMVNIASGRTNWAFQVGQPPNWLASELFPDDCR
jgi:hypothetical protein